MLVDFNGHSRKMGARPAGDEVPVELSVHSRRPRPYGRTTFTGDRPARVPALRIWVLVGLFLIVGCRAAKETEVIPTAGAAVVIAPALPSRTPAPPTGTATRPAPSATPPPTNTPLPAPTQRPSATPRPELVIAAPGGWDGRLQPVLETLPESPWEFRYTGFADPAGALAAGEAQLALTTGDTGIPLGQRPLAFAVPFTTAWEETFLSTALEAQANGHSFARIIPWDELTPDWKALPVEGKHPTDADYPFQQPYSLQAAPEWQAAAEWLAPHLAPAVSAGGMVHLAAAGDIMLDRTLGEAINNGRPEYPFANVAHLFQAADVAVGNLECSLGDVGAPAEKAYTFRAPPGGAEALALAGFDVVSLANNHGMDYGPETLLQGIGLLQDQGLAPIGAGANEQEAYAPAVLEVNGLTLAFLGYVNVPVEGRSPFFDTASWTATTDAPGLAWGDPGRVAADVAAAKELADHVIVVLHSGYEYVMPPSQEQLDVSHAAIDAGAALVIGHHAHILQGVEFYNDGVIVYGLGNFAFTIDGPPETAILNVWLDESGVRQINFIPAVIQLGGQPRLASPEEAPLILDQIYRLTNSLNPR